MAKRRFCRGQGDALGCDCITAIGFHTDVAFNVPANGNNDDNGKSYIDGWNNIEDFKHGISLRHLRSMPLGNLQ